jgi:phosphoenolpyruvate carboxylase
MEVEGNEFCKECERRSLALTNSPEYAHQCVQTENNYDLHYKEIKESLLCLKKINKEVEAIPESHQKTIKLISEFKDKYEKYIEKYNAKLMELKKEKGENEAWRTRAKQEIRE